MGTKVGVTSAPEVKQVAYGFATPLSPWSDGQLIFKLHPDLNVLGIIIVIVAAVNI